MWFLYVLAYLAVSCLFGYFTRKIASDKGHDSVGYFWLGFFLELVGVIIAACLSDQTHHAYQVSAYGHPQSSDSFYGGRLKPSEPASWECGYCKQVNSNNLQYCLKCRRDRYIARKETCPSCGASNTLGNETCFACNQPMRKGIEPQIQPAVPAKEGAEKLVCPSCAALNSKEARFCKKCGGAMDALSPWKCASCRADNDFDADFCSYCGVHRA